MKVPAVGAAVSATEAAWSLPRRGGKSSATVGTHNISNLRSEQQRFAN